VTKQQARRLLHNYAHWAHGQSWSQDDFLSNFSECWGLAPPNVEYAAAVVPEALEHIVQVVWYPTRRDI